MKQSIFKIFILLFIICYVLPVHASSDYWKDIKVNFKKCTTGSNENVTIQLFVDGTKQGDPINLTAANNYSHTFEHLRIFKPESPVEYKYEVKIFKDGKYSLISPKNYSYEKTHIDKWVQIVPENIKPGHTYVITTDNWNYENNGFSKTIYLRGDITAKGAPVMAEYNIIDGFPSYYYIDGEPIENTKWTVSSVDRNDPNYNDFKDYLVFTNESGEKRLTLTGYRNNDNVNFIFRHTSKSGFVESENSWNSNKVTLSYVPGSKGRFYIGTHNVWPDGNNNEMQYLTLSGQNQYQAGANIANAAQFKAYEHIEKDVVTGVVEKIEESLCKKDYVVLDRDSNYKKTININFDCKGCENKLKKGVVLQLFVDGKRVEDGKVTLNSKNQFRYTFNDLPYFYDGSYKEINYELKILRNGKYYTVPKKYINNKQETIHKWVQVFPKDIKAGHKYVLVGENANFESNGLSRYVYLRGDITSSEAKVSQEYNVIDGKKTYYIIDAKTEDNTLWTVSNVGSDDPNYNDFKDYLMFTNETENKKLTLTGYNNGGSINFIYKRSGKSGYNSDEDSWNTNKVKLINADNVEGKFFIGTHNVWPDESNNIMQYISMNNQLQYGSTSNTDNAARFMIFEYVEKNVVSVSKVNLRASLCEVLNLNKITNPDTRREVLLLAILVVVSGAYFIYRKKKDKSLVEDI